MFLKQVLSKILYVFYVLVVVFILLEVILRIYNPIPVRLKGDKIVLPINQEIRFKNNFPQFDAEIIHHKNNLGFRGREMPENVADALSIIAIGGSTTECYFVSDDKVWTQVLEDSLKKEFPDVWVNNAGLNGHSTFGHRVLLEDHVAHLQPDYVLFLTGVNDIERDDLGDFDNSMIKGKGFDNETNPLKRWGKTIVKNSEVVNLFYNFSKAYNAKNKEIFIDKVLELNPSDTLTLDKAYEASVLQEQTRFTQAYIQRIAQLATICKENNITPVFMTQPYLFGFGIDPPTGTDLAKAKLSENKNGELAWKKLELYNQALRNYCRENNIALIDLAEKMPKNSRYFYDDMHFTNEGSLLVGSLISVSLRNELLKK